MANEQKLTIMLADDHAIIRDGLRSLFEDEPNMTVVGEADNGIAIRQKAHNLQPDVILMDISMPDLNGMATTRLVKQELPDTHIIGLSVYSDRQFVVGMLGAGAEGYLVKSDAFKEVIHAIRRVLKHHIVLSRQVQKIVFRDYQRLLVNNQDIKKTLSEEEEKVIHGLLSEKTVDQVAEDLGLDTETVDDLQTKFVRQWLSMA